MGVLAMDRIVSGRAPEMVLGGGGDIIWRIRGREGGEFSKGQRPKGVGWG